MKIEFGVANEITRGNRGKGDQTEAEEQSDFGAVAEEGGEGIPERANA